MSGTGRRFLAELAVTEVTKVKSELTKVTQELTWMHNSTTHQQPLIDSVRNRQEEELFKAYDDVKELK